MLVSTERTSSPEAGRGLGVFAVLFVLAILGVTAWMLVLASREQSTGGLITLTILWLGQRSHCDSEAPRVGAVVVEAAAERAIHSIPF